MRPKEPKPQIYPADCTSAISVLVRGSGDVASAVALRLWQAGFLVFLHEESPPTATRRGMSFTDAAFDGQASLEGVWSRKAQKPFPTQGPEPQDIPFFFGHFQYWLNELHPQILIDARMRKHSAPESLLGLAPLTIGMGPGFTAGQNTTLAVETAWGDSLGRVIAQGSTKALEGEPVPLGGAARERYVYSPADGVFRTQQRIGTPVRAGEIVAWVEDFALPAPLNGVVRGLTHDGVPVQKNTKVIEIDPRGDPALVFRVPPRAEQIAQGTLHAVIKWRDKT